MKKLIALMAVLFLMTSAIPKERKKPLTVLIPPKHIVDSKIALDSLEVSVIELNNVLNQ